MKTGCISIIVSIGFIMDEISILQIKKEKLKSKEKMINVMKTYSSRVSILSGYLKYESEKTKKLLKTKFKKLKKVNKKLWEVEDRLRLFEKNKEFNKEFIKDARSVYRLNDERFKLKRQIDEMFDSDLLEEKSYEKY